MPDGTWAVNAAGTWSTATNWVSSIIADGQDFFAYLTTNITAARTVTLDTSRNIAGIEFSDGGVSSFGWTLAASGGSILTLDRTDPVVPPVLSVLTPTTVSLPLAGSRAFDKYGTATLTLTSTASTLTGNVIIQEGDLVLGGTAQSGNVLPTIGSLNGMSNSQTFTILSNAAFTVPYLVSSPGNLQIRNTAVNGCTINYLEYMDSTSATLGTGPYGVNGNAYMTSGDGSLPAKLAWFFGGTTAASTAHVYWSSSSPLTHTNDVFLNNISVTGQTITAHLYSNSASTTNCLTISGNVNRVGAGTCTFTLRGSNAGNNEISGVISGATAITKNDAGTWRVTGANTFTSSVTLTAGKLLISQGGATTGSLGASSSTSAITLTAGTLEIDTSETSGAETFNKPTSTMACSGATIKNTSGANTLTTGAVTMNAATAFDIAASTSLTITAAIGGAVANDLAKNSTGALYLTNTGSGYLGGTSINAGSLYITKLASAGTASSIGAPTTATTKHFIFMNTNTNFIYIGTTADTTNDRPFVPVGTNPSISIYSDGTGSGSMTIGSTWNNTYSTGTRTFNVLGDSANTNTWSGAFGAPPSGSLYLTKNGSTRWDFTNATFGVAYLSVQEGILGLGSYNRTITSSLTVYNTGHVQLLAPYTFNTGNISFGTGGKIEAELVNASATLLVPSDCTESQKAVLIATNTTTGGNTIGGAVTINGVIDVHSTPSVQVSTAGNGLVFGTGTVTVSSTGMIRTKAIVSSSQRGQCRYSNLVLQSGSKLKIGYAS